ncbi:NGG1 interacting factor [Cichlidogyrus casuarinus]|uniref:NIF3-like protein 1 n=1 Tax=Cichlidogyrus casuarinus TaxID=1844966 RepID=A0ABD2Q2X9_9PLAT
MAQRLRQIVSILHEISCSNMAESWDNVGLLVNCGFQNEVRRIVVCNDLTDSVLKAAISSNPPTNLIVSYHPPIFSALKKLDIDNWKERVLIECIKHDISVFSPHTGLDAKTNGINDWLLSPFKLFHIIPLAPKSSPIVGYTVCDLYYSTKSVDFILRWNFSASSVVSEDTHKCLRFKVPNEKLEEIRQEALKSDLELQVRASYPSQEIKHGCGRLGILDSENKLNIAQLVETYKKLLNLPYLRVALGVGRSMQSIVTGIAVCAGSGATLFNQSSQAQLADVYVTGEASHHEILAWTHLGISVLIAGHTNTERPYLKNQFVSQLREKLPSVEVHFSECDTDPDPIL